LYGSLSLAIEVQQGSADVSRGAKLCPDNDAIHSGIRPKAEMTRLYDELNHWAPYRKG